LTWYYQVVYILIMQKKPIIHKVSYRLPDDIKKILAEIIKAQDYKYDTQANIHALKFYDRVHKRLAKLSADDHRSVEDEINYLASEEEERTKTK
jgi:flagellar biosynthesis regulator FlaF